MALVWKPPTACSPRYQSQLIASLGAGVDHILEDPSVPRHVPLSASSTRIWWAAMSE